MKKILLATLLGILGIATWVLAQGTSPGWAGAMWVWDEADAHTIAQNNEPRYLRCKFTLSAKPQSAELWITVDNRYVAYVNGQKVGEDSQWETVEKIDVAKHLVAGKNVLAIKATNAGGVAGVIARLHIKTADKKDLFIVTDDKTKVTQSAAKGWEQASFDDASWFNAVVLGDTSIGPWNVGGAVAQKGKGKKGGGQFGYDTNETVTVKGRLTPEEQMKHFVVPKDFEIELVAADPLVINPITMVMDDKGRIIVSESHTYRYGPPGSPIKPYANPVVRLEPNGKGGFTRTLVADGFADPVMGIAVKGDKLWLTANDYLYTYDLPKGAFLPSPPGTPGGEGSGVRGESRATTTPHSAQQDGPKFPGDSAPSPPAPLPLSTGGEGSKAKNAQRPLDDTQKQQLKDALAVAANWRLQTDVRLKAVWQIKQLNHPDAVDALITLLSGELDDVTVVVGQHLGEIGTPKALAALVSGPPRDDRDRDRLRFPNPSANPHAAFAMAFVRAKAEEQLKGKGKPKEAPAQGKGIATNKKTIVTDLNKAWNPFGMFVLEWGPDGKLYMSVGNHNIKLQGPDKNQTTGRGSSGIIVRMNPDGSKMERLTHGLRVPYSFEMDPFGQLWLLSNGEGNPNRFVRVIDGVDYHCYSRGAVDNNWLAGNHPLAPPSEELHRGAHTQLIRYYGAAYPKEYWGNLFLCNWGAHGYAGPNRAINRFILDDRNNVVGREPLVWCKDPHFRPAHIILDQDGSLLIADWYGRDDESDLTGRIWRLRYKGKDAPIVKHKLDSDEWKNDDYAIEALGSPSHLIREKAIEELLNRGDKGIKKLGLHAAVAKEPLGAANAMWVLMRLNNAAAKTAISQGYKNPDWNVRQLMIKIGRRHIVPGLEGLNDVYSQILDKDKKEVSNVWVEFQSLHVAFGKDPGGMAISLANIIEKYGAASDPHVRYAAAWQFATVGTDHTYAQLLKSDDANVRLAGLIAIDIACYENIPSKKAALAALAKALENPGKLDHQLLLEVARLNGDASIVPALGKLIERDDLPAATIAKAVLVLKAKSGGNLAASKLTAAAGKRLVEAVEKGQLKIASPADQLVLFEFLESEGPTAFALKQIGGQLNSSNKELRLAAHTLARRFGPRASPIAEQLWPSVFNPKAKFEDTLESLSTIARTEAKPDWDKWKLGLFHEDRFIRAETVRWWRNFKEDRNLQPRLSHNIESLVTKDPTIREDIAAVYRHWGYDDKWLKEASLPIPVRDKGELEKYAVDELAKMPAGDRAKRAAMGQQVFERNACTKCHTTATATTLLAPSLKGIAQQKVDYLIESVLHPSKVIKTGWEVEVIETKKGQVITGLVKEDGKALQVFTLDGWSKGPLRIDKADIETRAVSKTSIMPEGQEATLSRREFVDLIAYLQTLK